MSECVEWRKQGIRVPLSSPSRTAPFSSTLTHYSSQNPKNRHFFFLFPMAGGIDMSLDDIMKRSAAAVASRCRFTVVRNPARTTSYPITQARQKSMVALPEMVLEESGAAKIESGTKIDRVPEGDKEKKQ
ncbi:uncharacterized protein LOC114395276 [Glycine soja]|uniref:uncharacterized protein LOC114395276 n=1 Tax=Glycine soja TaxID=3848 RepID=UPI00103E6F0C|nr:uncharacterized protein LOC114395276 [Glycine soja]